MATRIGHASIDEKEKLPGAPPETRMEKRFASGIGITEDGNFWPGQRILMLQRKLPLSVKQDAPIPISAIARASEIL